MVGGIVIEVVEQAERVFIDCRDTKYRDTCSIFVERDKNSERVEIGDMVWWQGHKAFWTPQANRLSEEESDKRGNKHGIHYEIVLKRIGYSGVTLVR